MIYLLDNVAGQCFIQEKNTIFWKLCKTLAYRKRSICTGMFGCYFKCVIKE